MKRANSRGEPGWIFRGVTVVGAFLLGACGTKPQPASGGTQLSEATSAEPEKVSVQKVSTRVAHRHDDASKVGHASPRVPSQTADRPSLPPDLFTGKSVEVPMERDRALRVAHAPDKNDHAIVYLHGMCGNPKGAEPWLGRALEEGTVIVVRANVPCTDRPGYKWPKDLDAIQTRIDAALARVQTERNGLLDTERVTLIGYSQGAHRAELLAARTPERYPKVILGGPPTPPLPESFRPGTSVAVLGGELENTDYMQEGTAALAAAGLHSEFFLLPGAHHGGYGPQGPAVMDRVFTWLDQTQAPASGSRSVRLE